MKLLELVSKEFITIVEYLMIDNAVEESRIIVEREIFRQLLEKYAYMPFSQKTKIYKDLNFIIHDKNNYTMPHKDPITKKTTRKVIINFKAYETIKNLYQNNINM